jgi:hypothetical protein
LTPPPSDIEKRLVAGARHVGIELGDASRSDEEGVTVAALPEDAGVQVADVDVGDLDAAAEQAAVELQVGGLAVEEQLELEVRGQRDVEGDAVELALVDVEVGLEQGVVVARERAAPVIADLRRDLEAIVARGLGSRGHGERREDRGEGESFHGLSSDGRWSGIPSGEIQQRLYQGVRR